MDPTKQTITAAQLLLLVSSLRQRISALEAEVAALKG